MDNVTNNYPSVQAIEEHWTNKGFNCKIEINSYEDDSYFDIILNGKLYGGGFYESELDNVLDDINTYIGGIYDAINNINEYKIIKK